MFPAIELFLRSDKRSLEIFRSLSFDRRSHVTSARRCFIDILYCYFCLNDPNDVCTRKYRAIVRFIFGYAAVVWRPSYLAKKWTRGASTVNFRLVSLTRLNRSAVRLPAPIYLSYFWVYLPYLSVGPTPTLGGLLFSFKVPSHCTRTAQLLQTYSSFVHNHTRPLHRALKMSFVRNDLVYTPIFTRFIIIRVIRLFCTFLTRSLHLTRLIVFIFVVIFQSNKVYPSYAYSICNRLSAHTF